MHATLKARSGLVLGYHKYQVLFSLTLHFLPFQLHEMQEASRAQHQRELAHVREATAMEVKQYYLQCLHQLVNTGCANNHTVRTSSHFDPVTNERGQPHITPHMDFRVQQPFTGSESEWTSCDARENCPPKGANFTMSSTTLATSASSKDVLKDSITNFQQQKLSAEKEKRKKSTTRSEKRKSAITPSSSTSFIRTQSHGSVGHGQYGRTSSSGAMPAVGMRKNQTLKGGARQSSRGVGGVAGSMSVKKDTTGHSGAGKRPRSVAGEHLVHNDRGVSGVRESR